MVPSRHGAVRRLFARDGTADRGLMTGITGIAQPLRIVGRLPPLLIGFLSSALAWLCVCVCYRVFCVLDLPAICSGAMAHFSQS